MPEIDIEGILPPPPTPPPVPHFQEIQSLGPLVPTTPNLYVSGERLPGSVKLQEESDWVTFQREHYHNLDSNFHSHDHAALAQLRSGTTIRQATW